MEVVEFLKGRGCVAPEHEYIQEGGPHNKKRAYKKVSDGLKKDKFLRMRGEDPKKGRAINYLYLKDSPVVEKYRKSDYDKNMVVKETWINDRKIKEATTTASPELMKKIENSKNGIVVQTS